MPTAELILVMSPSQGMRIHSLTGSTVSYARAICKHTPLAAEHVAVLVTEASFTVFKKTTVFAMATTKTFTALQKNCALSHGMNTRILCSAIIRLCLQSLHASGKDVTFNLQPLSLFVQQLCILIALL